MKLTSQAFRLAKIRRRLARAALFAALMPGGGIAHAELAQTDVQKATVVYNLSRFIRWPAESFTAPDAALTFCVPEPFSGALGAALAGKQAHNRPLRVLLFNRETLAECHVLYLEATEDWAEILQSLHGQPILSVSEAEAFVQHGGIVGLFASGERVRFEINLDAARQNGLEISAALLELAQRVHHTTLP
jgi:hypothetical protein